MAEFYVEEGIGETRRIRVENGRIALAWVDWGETLIVGSRVRAKLVKRLPGEASFLAETSEGETIWVYSRSGSETEGTTVTVQIQRAPIGERGRRKPATGYITDETARRWTHLERARSNGHEYRTVRRFPVEGWDEISELALSGRVEFSGGSITVSPTPAMTLFDIDGTEPPLALSLAAVPVIAETLAKLDLHGSIGIDFPTLTKKEDRKKVDEALGEALWQYPSERTAMNGFGFVQLVGRVDGPSILHRYTFSRTAACARIALRLAERAEGTGPVLLLTVHPALKVKLKPEWLDELARRMGKQVRIETDPGLALEAPHAQFVKQ